jgi:uncharacterized membrane-anchored protein
MKWALAILAVVAAGQLAIPAYMINRQETVLREGRAYKFKTAPVDPYDAFRGRYVALRFEQNHAPWRGTNHAPHRTKAYALVEEGADGFAVVREVSPQPPATGDFLKVQVNYSGWGTNASMACFSMPFARYYMEETQAPKAERAYWDNNRRTNVNTYVVVRVKDGNSALEDLYLNGTPVREFLRQHPSTK